LFELVASALGLVVAQPHPEAVATRIDSADPLIGADDALMRQAMQASGALSKREAVELGLRTLVRLQQQGEIRSYRGQMQWEGDLEAHRLDADQENLGPADREQARL
jgi:Arc/MetJ family transcription regulator